MSLLHVRADHTERVNVIARAHTPACMWEPEADQWVCTPNDSALHAQDSCFMSMGGHKFHSLAFLLQQHGTDLFAPTLPLRGLSLRHSHTFLPLPLAVAFLFHVVVVRH